MASSTGPTAPRLCTAINLVGRRLRRRRGHAKILTQKAAREIEAELHSELRVGALAGSHFRQRDGQALNDGRVLGA